MVNETNTNEVVEDVFELKGESPWIAISALVIRILGMITLAAYSVWFLFHVGGNLGTVSETESIALGNLAAVISGAAPGVVAMTGLEIAGWIIACILSALFLVFVWNEWRKKIVREWRWVWRLITSGSIWDKLLGAVCLVLVLCETILWIMVTIVTVVIVYINLRVLIPILP